MIDYLTRHLTRRVTTGLVAAAVALPLMGLAGMVTSAKAATLEEIKKRGYLIVATEDDFRPF